MRRCDYAGGELIGAPSTNQAQARSVLQGAAWSNFVWALRCTGAI